MTEIEKLPLVIDILCKSSFTLVDLLKSGDILDELKYGNEDLLRFLSTEENFKGLLCYALMIENFEICKQKRKNLYYSSCCSEIIYSKCERFAKLIQSGGNTYINILLSFLEKESICESLSSTFSRIILVFIKLAPEVLKQRLDKTHFEGCIKHMYCYGIVESLRCLLDLPYENTTQYWWGKTDDALKSIITKLSQPDLSPLFYENLKEFVASLIFRGATTGSESPSPAANALLTALCQSQNIIALIRIGKDLSNQHRSAAVLYILERIVMREKPENFCGLGGYEMANYQPRMTADERKNVGIVPIRTLDKILGTIVENCHFLKSMLRGYMRTTKPVLVPIGLENEFNTGSVQAGKGLIAVGSLIRTLTETHEGHLIQALSYNSVYSEFFYAVLNTSFNSLFINDFVRTMKVLIDGSAHPAMKYFFDDSNFFSKTLDYFLKTNQLNITQPLPAAFYSIIVHIYDQCCALNTDYEVGEPPEVLPTITELGRYLQDLDGWLKLKRENFLNISCMVLLNKLRGENGPELNKYFEPNNNVRVIPVK